MRTYTWFVFLICHIGNIDTLISCDFEDGLCDWSDVSVTKYNWTVSSGKSPDFTSGPLYDHTFTDNFGHYMFTHGARASRSAVAVLRSKEINITRTVNLSFWYHMNGAGIGNLSLVKEERNGSTTLWTKHGRQSFAWLQAGVALSPGIFRLRFESTVVSPHSSDIALDDIILETEPKVLRTRPIPTTTTTTVATKTTTTTFPTRPPLTCPVRDPGVTLPGSCDFEVSKMCGYNSTETSSVQWLRHKGHKGSLFGEHISGDHGTGKGYYAYLRTDGNDKIGENASLTSPELSKQTRVCLQFAYIIVSKPEVTLNVYAVTSGTRDLMAAITDHDMTSWGVYNVGLCAETDTRIQFEAAKEEYLGFVGLDDIIITSGNCDEQYTNKASSSKVTTDMNHQLSTARNAVHTTQEPHTPFTLTRSSSTKAKSLKPHVTTLPSTQGTLATPMFHSTIGPDLYLGSSHNSQKTSKSAKTPSQQHASDQPVHPTRETTRLLNSAHVTAGLVTGSVENILSCDFEDGPCDWSDVSASKYEWKISSGRSPDFTSGPQNDHTFKDYFGHYLLAHGGMARKNSVAILRSKLVKVTKAVNLTFWYHMNGNGVGNLSLIREEHHASTILWDKQGRQGMEWLQASVHMPPGTFRLRFESTVFRPHGSDIALDDIRLSSEPIVLRARPTPTTTTTTVATTTPTTTFPTRPPLTCTVRDPGVTLQGSCDFEVSKMCGYNSTKTSSVQWLRQKGLKGSIFGEHISGDHGTGKGSYVFLRTDGNSINGQKASLISPNLAKQTRVCLQFAYIIVSEPEVTLKVYSVSSGSRESLAAIADHKMTSWKVYNVSLCAETDTRIEFEAERRAYLGYVGLDDIQLTSGRCGDIYTVDKPSPSQKMSTEATVSNMRTESLTPLQASSTGQGQPTKSKESLTSLPASSTGHAQLTNTKWSTMKTSLTPLPTSSKSVQFRSTGTSRVTESSGLSSKYPITLKRTDPYISPAGIDSSTSGFSLNNVINKDVYTTEYIIISSAVGSSNVRQLSGNKDPTPAVAKETDQVLSNDETLTTIVLSVLFALFFMVVIVSVIKCRQLNKLEVPETTSVASDVHSRQTVSIDMTKL